MPYRPLEALTDETLPAATPLRFVAEGESVDASAAAVAGFRGQAGKVLALGAADGGPAVLLGLGDRPLAFVALRARPGRLAPGDYRLEPRAGLDEAQAALAWALGAHGYERFKGPPKEGRARLAVSPAGFAAAAPIARACALARDMVDTPAGHMGPAEIEDEVRAVAAAYGAGVSVVTGEDLLTQGYPAVHAVGRAAAPNRAPRMIELTWTGADDGARLVIVGKGVAFDTGGLDIKPSAGMRLMKKDMGGAAHALALAGLVMERRLPVRLTLLIPAVENAISGDAMRPGDVLDTRAGKTVEVGNTDAEGRLILADALTRAAELAPDLTIDLATLTGAARVALGPQVIPFFTDDEALAADLVRASAEANDPLWRLPLWAPYDAALDSDVADLKNDPDGWAQAGSVTAALFLKRFAPTTGAWVHFDMFAWNPKGGPGSPVGAEAQAIRALDRLLVGRFGGGA